ncbi:TolC family protein [Bacillus dakarensis]|uniref:TolC family protein n=1 Tax=Robertmurraya dakarensis TaxID=1926278 RepID=UPI0009817429|nr:TolC family protein [Bacillus dakarensis]
MKKYTALGLAFMLAMPAMSTAALADGTEPEETEIEEVVENENENENENVENEETTEDTTEETTEEGTGLELEELDSLSLEEAVERALNNSPMLIEMKYQTEILESQYGDANHNFRDLERDIKDLEDTREDLRDMQSSGGGRTFQERLAIQNQLELIDDKIKGLEDALENLKSGKATLAYNEAEFEESVKMTATANFSQLLMTKDQLGLQRQAYQSKEKEMAVLKLQYDLGMVSLDDYNKNRRDLLRQKTDLKKAEEQYTKDMVEYTLDLGIGYHAAFELEPMELDNLELLEQETETSELVENSFVYKKQLETISLAEYTRDQVYEDDDSTSFQKTEQDLNVELEKEKLVQLKLDLEEAIRTLYHDVAVGYQALEDAELDYQYAKEDYEILRKQYELGLISRINYELASTSVDQARIAYEGAKQSYFLLTKQVEMLEAGVIQTGA